MKATLITLILILSITGCSTPVAHVEAAGRQPAQAENDIPSPRKFLASLLTVYEPADMYPADLADGSTAAYFDWRGCLDGKAARSPVKMTGGQLDERCRPDTLYTWQDDRMVENFKQATSGKHWAAGFGQASLYTHINPVATFAYGYASIRIKLRPNVNFKVFPLDGPSVNDFCNDFLKPEERADTIVVRIFAGGTDYILCSTGPIESWSLGTQKHYDEVVNSTLWYFHEAPRHNWLPYHQRIPDDGLRTVSPLFISEAEQRDFDGHSFTQDTLIANLLAFRTMIDNHRELIRYAPGVSPDPNRHFMTRHPIYWNSRGAAVQLPRAAVPAAPKLPSAVNGHYIYRSPNGRYQISLPANLFFPYDDSDPNNLAIYSRDVRLSVNLASQPSTGQSLNDLFRQELSVDGRTVTYKTIDPKKRTFVLSGIDGPMIFYIKTIETEGGFHALSTYYDKSLGAVFNPVVGTIATGFKALP